MVEAEVVLVAEVEITQEADANIQNLKLHPMKNKILILVMCILYTAISFAQNEVDALRYSQLTFGGTARSNGMAGAFGALGADFSGLSINPGGIAMYRKSELSFTPSIFSQTTTSNYNGVTADDSKYNFNFGNIGITGTFFNHQLKDGEKGWVSGHVGFGYNRTNNFHNRINIEGANSTSSLLDVYLGQANGLDFSKLDQFSSGLAFNTYLIDTVSGDNRKYYSPVPYGGVYQRKSIETSGSMGETVFSFGGNYNNKLYLGATIGIPHIRYTEESDYNEKDHKDTIPGFQSFTMNQYVSTRGTGVNFKLGMIYRATDWFRFGLAYHSPSVFTMHDEYKYSMKSQFDNGNSYNEDSPSGTFDYTFTTPSRTIASLAFVIQKRAIISADYEFVDYSTARLHSSPNIFLDANAQVRKKYTQASNVRLGAEVRFDPFVVRAGYALYGNPYKANVNTDASRSSYTLGFGFREKDYYLDFAYVLTTYKEDYYLYDPTNVNRFHGDFWC